MYHSAWLLANVSPHQEASLGPVSCARLSAGYALTGFEVLSHRDKDQR